jgi:hypothetical protein
VGNGIFGEFGEENFNHGEYEDPNCPVADFWRETELFREYVSDRMP